jgi:hypothetical protein
MIARVAKRLNEENNCGMRQDRDTDLFPWILSIGLLAAGAFSTVLIMAPPAVRVPRAIAAIPAMNAPAPPPALQVPLQALPATTPAALSDRPELALVNNPIWQCEVNGQKIFSDSPCGAGASIRPLNETNRMNSTPIIPSSAYAPYEPPYTEPYSEDAQSVPGNTVYVSRPVYWHRMPPRPARGHPEPHGAPHAHGM